MTCFWSKKKNVRKFCGFLKTWKNPKSSNCYYLFFLCKQKKNGRKFYDFSKKCPKPKNGYFFDPKSTNIDQNRCQDALHFRLHFLIDFWSILAPNLDLLDLKKRGFSLRKIKSVEKSPFEVNIDF